MNRFKQARMIAGNKALEVVAEESSVSRNTIWKLENDKVDAGYSIVSKLADYYHVNVAWLIGQSDTPSLDESNQAVVKATGLSDTAISKLQIMKAWGLSEALNQILESEAFIHAVERFEAGKLIYQTDTETPEEARINDQAYVNSIRDTGGKVSDFALLSKETQSDMLVASATQIFGNLLRDLLKGGKDNGNS